MADRLTALDPEGAPYSDERRDHFAPLGGGASGLEEATRVPEGMPVVTFHQQWSIWRRPSVSGSSAKSKTGRASRPRPGTSPIWNARSRPAIRWILYSDLTYPEVPEKVAARAGCRAVRLPQSVDSRDGTKTLTAWFGAMVAALESAKEK